MDNIEQLMNDKSFYTIIRRFKYQYNKYKALDELDGKFYDKHLREAYQNSKRELEDTTNRLVLMVFGAFIDPNNTSLEFSQDVMEHRSWTRSIVGHSVSSREYKVVVDDKAYFEFVQELLRQYYKVMDDG